MGLSQQAAPPAGRAAAPSDSSQRVDALTPPDVPSGWTPPSPSPPVQVGYLSEEGPSTPEVFSSSSSWESEPGNSRRHYRRAATGPRCGPTRSPPPHAVPRTRAPRARSVHRSGNPALKKSRRRAPPTRAPRGVKRRQSITEGRGSPRRKQPQLQQGDEQSHTTLEIPGRHRGPAGAPLPMSRYTLSYLQLTGIITPERASRIVVVSTPEGQRTPLRTRSQVQPPNEWGRDIPPGIVRMLQQIRAPHARPQPPPPQREARPNARTSRPAIVPTGPPMEFNMVSIPSPRVLSRRGQHSPSPAWSPAVTSSGHSVRHMSPEHWSPTRTPGGAGSHQKQDPPDLPPTLLAPLFESVMSAPRGGTTHSASDEEVEQYGVHYSAPPGLPHTLLAPPFERVMSASRGGTTHREYDEDIQQYEVQYSAPPSLGEWPPNPSTPLSVRRAQRLCTELPGMAQQGQGWVRDLHARHSTMLYSMQADTPSPSRAEGPMKHGRASRDAT